MNPIEFLGDEEATAAATLVIVLLPVDGAVDVPPSGCPRCAVRFVE